MIRTRCACGRRHGRATDPARRRVLGSLGAGLALGALAALGGLAGCGERAADAKPPAPVEITAATACELDGMLLADYPGPKAQIHYVGMAAPMFHCDTVELFALLLKPEQVRAVAIAYVQDMGQTDWDHPAGHWIDARQALFVRGSKRRGSMGPTLASFAKEDDARRFIAEWGGELLRFAEVKPEMVDLSGGARFDSKM